MVAETQADLALSVMLSAPLISYLLAHHQTWHLLVDQLDRVKIVCTVRTIAFELGFARAERQTPATLRPSFRTLTLLNWLVFCFELDEQFPLRALSASTAPNCSTDLRGSPESWSSSRTFDDWSRLRRDAPQASQSNIAPESLALAHSSSRTKQALRRS